jgi:hypothetical protein
MGRLADLSSKPMIREYAMGAAQRAVNPVADFIAPPVFVSSSIGRFKKYTEKNRFRLPNTLRGLGGRAAELSFEVADANYNCTPRALDFPVDNLEQLEESGLESMLQEGAQMIAEVSGLVHEKTVIDAALVAAGAGTAKTWSGATPSDPVDDLDAAIMTVIKAAKYGSLMGVGVLFGASAWRLFKNCSLVRSKFIVGNSSKAGTGLAIPTADMSGSLLLGDPEIKVSMMCFDSAAEGLAESVQFVLDGSVLVFARSPNPTRRDPSFMKTFRLQGQWMVPGAYQRDDGRVEVAKFDWSEDVQVANSTAIVRLNPS